jgi:hypothetical protein
LNVTLDSNALEAAAKVMGKLDAFERGKKKGIARVTDIFEKHSEKRIGRISARRIPSRAEVAAHRRKKKYGRRRKGVRKARSVSNAPAWKRTGNTQAGLDKEVNDDSGRVFIGGPAAQYATLGPRNRHELGVSWTPKDPALGIMRINPFFTEAETIYGPQAPAAFEQEIKNELDD